MSNGMSGLYVGTSGLNVAQAALNTTAHNLANINTDGYTRQQITYRTSNYYTIGNNGNSTMVCGTGVDVSEIRRVRDELIDQSYRQEKGRLGYYDSQYEAVSEIESLFGEIGDSSFESTMKDLKTAVNEISKNPTSTIARSSLIQTATTFLSKSQSIYKSLQEYQSNLNTKVNNMIDKINSLGNTIGSLNKQISKIESTGEKANDLRDQRDKALDELSGYIKIDYKEDDKGIVSVTAEGMTFVSNSTVFAMGSEKIDGTDLLKPTWPAFENRDVFADAEQITVIDNNDIGELKGLLLARGNKSVDYTDVPDTSKYDMTDATQAAKYQADCDYYNKYIDPSVVLSTMASLDKLVNGIVSSINDTLCPEKTATFTATDGTVYTDATVLDPDKTSYGNDQNKSKGVELFSRKDIDTIDSKDTNENSRYKEVKGQDGITYYVKKDTNPLGLKSDYTLNNLRINSKVLQDKATIPLTTAEGNEDFERGKKLVKAWDTPFASLNPSTYSKEDFDSFYNSLIFEVSDAGKVLNNIVTNQTSMTNGYDNQRLQTAGVSSDEELQNMIKFQQAYNAASRYVNVVSEMLEHIVTKLGG